MQPTIEQRQPRAPVRIGFGKICPLQAFFCAQTVLVTLGHWRILPAD